jgi:hypothetical protein
MNLLFFVLRLWAVSFWNCIFKCALADQNIRNFNSLTTETSQVRDVSNLMPMLLEDPAPLYVLTNAGGKRRVKVTNPKIEFFDDADLPMTTSANNGTDYASNATIIVVADVTLFAVRDVVQVAKAATNAALEELVLVTALGTNSITVTRAFAGTTADTITATGTLKILGSAQTEAGAINNPRTPARLAKTSGCQIFETPIAVTRSAAATKVYGTYSERERQQFLAMRRQRLEIENAGLFGAYSETLSGTASFYTSQGVRSIIATNVQSMGQTITYQAFLTWAANVFKYSARDRLLVASPTFKSALDYLAANKQLTKSEDKVFGISLRRFVTSNGTFMLVNNYNMDGGLSDEAIAVDMSMIEFCYLEDNGVSLDTKLFKEYDTTNPKVIKDLLLTQCGWRIHQEARHGRAYNATSF